MTPCALGGVADVRSWSLDGLRDALVDRLRAAGVARDDRVVQAFRSVQRHVFLPGEPERAYRDEAGANQVGAQRPSHQLLFPARG